jgi:hypothetical protein
MIHRPVNIDERNSRIASLSLVVRKVENLINHHRYAEALESIYAALVEEGETKHSELYSLEQQLYKLGNPVCPLSLHLQHDLYKDRGHERFYVNSERNQSLSLVGDLSKQLGGTEYILYDIFTGEALDSGTLPDDQSNCIAAMQGICTVATDSALFYNRIARVYLLNAKWEYSERTIPSDPFFHSAIYNAERGLLLISYGLHIEVVNVFTGQLMYAWEHKDEYNQACGQFSKDGQWVYIYYDRGKIRKVKL